MKKYCGNIFLLPYTGNGSFLQTSMTNGSLTSDLWIVQSYKNVFQKLLEKFSVVGNTVNTVLSSNVSL